MNVHTRYLYHKPQTRIHTREQLAACATSDGGELRLTVAEETTDGVPTARRIDLRKWRGEQPTGKGLSLTAREARLILAALAAYDLDDLEELERGRDV